MSRDISALYRAYSTSEQLNPVMLVSAAFDSGALNMWNGYANLTYGEKTYVGGGYYLSITPPTETKEIRANGVQINLTGITAEAVSLALNEPCQGRSISATMAFIAGDTDGYLNFDVTAAGGKYYIESGLQSIINVKEGQTYRFDQSDSTNDGHRLRISTTSNGTHGGGSQYTTGWTEVGTAGTAGAYSQWVVPSGITGTAFYYYCQYHGGMGGTVTPTTAYILPTPFVLFEGVMDRMVLTDSGDDANIAIFCESRLIALENNNVRRYTPEDQKIDFPNDLGLEFVAGLQDVEIRWGS
jgi:hypothetical protein